MHMDYVLHPHYLTLKSQDRRTTADPNIGLWWDQHASAGFLGSWPCGFIDNTHQVGGVTGLTPTAHSSSNRTHLFLLGTCPPHSQVTRYRWGQAHLLRGQGHRLKPGHWVCFTSLGRWLQVYKFWHPFCLPQNRKGDRSLGPGPTLQAVPFR